MTKKSLWITLFLILFLTPFYFTFAQISNAGFIPGNIWYSKDPFEEGDKIKIYTLIYNPDSRQFSGTVFFFDKTTFLGNKSFVVPGKSLQDVSIDWTATSGDHLIFGQIQGAKFLTTNNTYQDASLSEIKTSESKRSVPKKIIPTPTETNTNPPNTSTDSNIVSSISNTIKENTPEVVSSTISTTTNAVESFRQDMGTLTENKKEVVQNEIKNLENKKTTPVSSTTKKDPAKSTIVEGTSPSSQGIFLKPFKYTELFALSLFSGVFNNKFIFYGLIVIIIFFIVRFIVRRVF